MGITTIMAMKNDRERHTTALFNKSDVILQKAPSNSQTSIMEEVKIQQNSLYICLSPIDDPMMPWSKHTSHGVK